MGTGLLRYRLDQNTDFEIKIYAVIILLGGLFVLRLNPFLGILVIGFAVFPFMYYKCLEFNLYAGTYCFGVNFMGYTVGKREPYPGIEFLFLKKNRTISRSGRYSWSATSSTSFDGYMKLADGVKILVVQERDKAKAVEKLQRIAQELKTTIFDMTEPRLM